MKNNKTVIVTGCSGSIGHLITEFLKKKKINVVGIDIKKNKNTDFYSCNLNKPKNLKIIYKKIKNKYKKVDILINCAGLIHNELTVKFKNGLITHSIKSWKKVIDNNLNITFYNTKFFIDYFNNFDASEQLIINFSSVNSKGQIGQSAYSAAKAAIEVATKVWSQELSAFNIRVAGISPGYFDFKSTNQNLNKQEKNNIIKLIPVKRFGKAKT